MLGDINIAEPGALIGFAGLESLKKPLAKTYLKVFKLVNSTGKRILDFIVDRRT